MIRSGLFRCIALGLWLFGGPAGFGAAAAEKQGMEHHGHSAGAAMGEACQVSVSLTDEAERRLGGALFEGPLGERHGMHGMPMPGMQGAHMDHRPKQGGAFFMAPNKIHHLEGVYSDECGFRLFFYNAFTEPIRADRFRGLIKIIPNDQSEPELMRFLSASQSGAVLHSPVSEKVGRPFDVELYVKFPESEEPQLFSIKVAAPAAAATRSTGTSAAGP